MSEPRENWIFLKNYGRVIVSFVMYYFAAVTVSCLPYFLIQFEAARTPESCKLFWVNAAHPGIAVSKWTSAEDAKLIELVSRFGGVNWDEIARCLGVSWATF